jgi:predicted ATPase
MGTKISKIEIQNFKTFDKIELKLKDFNLVIGLNASGKSNFIATFRFLRDIVTEGLDNAISLQGGMEYLLNSKHGFNKNFSINIEFSTKNNYIQVPLKDAKDRVEEFGIKIPEFDKVPKSLMVDLKKTQYEFELQFSESHEYIIIKDVLKTSGKVFIANENLIDDDNIKFKNKEIIGNIEFTTTFQKGYLDFQLNGTFDENYEKLLKDIFYLRRPIKVPEKSLLLESPSFIESAIAEIFVKNLVIYDIDPKESKKGAYIGGKKELNENGSNLALTIRNIIKDDKKRDEFCTLVNDLLPFVDGFNVEPFAGKNLIFKMKEKYNDDYWPASFLSDGTVNVISLIVATNFEEKPLKIFEEPEKNIHPSLIPKILHLFKDASEESQIIITSHNPEFVKHADIHDIFFIKRDDNGYSQITRPQNFKKVKMFLESELGLNELFIRNLIGE